MNSNWRLDHVWPLITNKSSRILILSLLRLKKKMIGITCGLSIPIAILKLHLSLYVCVCWVREHRQSIQIPHRPETCNKFSDRGWNPRNPSPFVFECPSEFDWLNQEVALPKSIHSILLYIKKRNKKLK